jgi:hypothetical protein
MPWRLETDTAERFKARGCFSWTFEVPASRYESRSMQNKKRTIHCQVDLLVLILMCECLSKEV